MIRQIGLRNVRLFGDIGYNFDLPALSIFTGTNSSGKSTILKSFLLLRQSQGLYETYGARPGILRLTGSQVDLGNYQSFVTDRNPERDVEISITVQEKMPSRVVRELAKNKNLALKLPSSQDNIDYILNSSFLFKSFKSATETDEAGQISTVAPQGLLDSADFSIIVNEMQISSWHVKKRRGATRYRLYFPLSEICEWDKGLKTYQQKSSNLDEELIVTTELDGLIPSNVIFGENRFSKTDQDKLPEQLPVHIRGTLRQFTKTLRRIHYLAPLRTAAKRYYLTNFDVTADLDPSGDFLPYILGGIIEEPIVYDVPPNLKLKIEHKLSQALDNWLYYLRTGMGFNSSSARDEFKSSTHKGTLVEISLKALKGELKHSIADSGFGYSQVLPILVRGLIAPPNSTLIIEQPELHLNPALQVRLADFFISLVRAGKQVIIETHSEHIVDALRVRTAQEKDGYLSNNSKIYFIDIKRGRPALHDMSIKPDGTLPEWPINFFGEAASLTGELLRAQKEHRRREKTQ